MIDFEYMNCFTELHLHLDGSISVESAKQLAKLQNIEIPDDDEKLKSMLMVDKDCHSLNDFLARFDFPLSLLQTKEALKLATINLLNELKDLGVMYTELKFAPMLLMGKGMSQKEGIEAVIEGINSVDGIIAQIILACYRSETVQHNTELVELAKEYLGKGVCAVDLAGAEALFPNDEYAYCLNLANEYNIPLTIHSGEADGPSSVYSALKYNPKRIGHGVRSSEDEALMDLLVEKGITLELCPTSNVVTCIYDNLSQFPLRKIMDKGIKVTISSDDMSPCNTNIKEEYRKLIKNFNLSYAEIRKILEDSVKAAFVDDETKKFLLNKIERNFIE